MSANSNLKSASETYLRLKSQRGHWYSQERNAAIDDNQGERHQAMVALQEHLGQTGTAAEEIQRLMGSPTKTLAKPDLVLQHEMNLKDDNYTFPKDATIWIYEWRHEHDYVYFFISAEQKVIHSAWYHAYE